MHRAGPMGISLLAAVAVGLPGRARGQETHRPLCFRGAPQARCSSFMITEMSLDARFTDVHAPDEHVMIGWSLGLLHNTGPRDAWGGELFASGEGDLRTGAALRWRHWLGQRASLDLSAGIHLGGNASSVPVNMGAPSFKVRLGYHDAIAATARIDVLTLKNPCYQTCTTGTVTSTRVYAGIELGSWYAAGATAVLGVLGAIALASWSY